MNHTRLLSLGSFSYRLVCLLIPVIVGASCDISTTQYKAAQTIQEGILLADY